MQAGIDRAKTGISYFPSWRVIVRSAWLRIVFGFLLIAAALALLWAPLAPQRLFDFDSANFALALETFNPSLHLPQPPGYPLYVGLTRVIYFFAGDAVLAFLIAGILAAAAAVLMLERLTTRMFGRTAGICAALLLITNPILWQAGMIDQVRVYLAVISTTVAFLLWPLWQNPLKSRQFVWACLLLGFLAGFRQETLFSLTPLLAITGLRARLFFRQWMSGGIALLAGVAPWLIVLIAGMGGYHAFAAEMQRYAHEQGGNSSLLLGASFSGEWKMFRGAMWWLSLSLAAWSPALLAVLLTKLFRRSNSPARDGAQQFFFLLAWFVPQFLFSVIIHIAAAGHALGFLPPLCAAGGWTLSRLSALAKGKVTIACMLLALALNVRFFLHPYATGTAEASYKMIRYNSNLISTTLDRIDALTTAPGVYLIDYNGWVTWRILEYYYPSTPLLHLPDPGANAAEPAWLIEQKLVLQTYASTDDMQLPACGTLLWLVRDNQVRQTLLGTPGAEDADNFVMIPARPGMSFQVGRYRLTTSTQPCK